jgi:hypothetical protein
MATGSPNNTVYSVHIDAALSDFSVSYRPTGMIAEQVFPHTAVDHQTDQFWRWNKSQAFRVARSDGLGTLVPDRAPAKMRLRGATPDGYKTKRYALADSISFDERKNGDASLNQQQHKVMSIQDELMLDFELRVKSMCQTTTNYASSNYTTLSGTAQWNNAGFTSIGTAGHSAIKAVIDGGKKAISASSGGLKPNTIIIPFEVAIVMNNDAGLVDLLKYTKDDMLVEDLLPPTLWGMKVLVPTATFQTTTEGEADSLSYVWGKSVWMGYVDPNPGLETLTFGTTFRWEDFQVRTWQEQRERIDVYEVSVNQDEHLVAADCGYLIQNAIA